jgi:hypothetical protein
MIFQQPEWLKDYRFIQAETHQDLLRSLDRENTGLKGELKAERTTRWTIVSFAFGLDGYEALLEREVWRVAD